MVNNFFAMGQNDKNYTPMDSAYIFTPKTIQDKVWLGGEYCISGQISKLDSQCRVISSFSVSSFENEFFS